MRVAVMQLLWWVAGAATAAVHARVVGCAGVLCVVVWVAGVCCAGPGAGAQLPCVDLARLCCVCAVPMALHVSERRYN